MMKIRLKAIFDKQKQNHSSIYLHYFVGKYRSGSLLNNEQTPCKHSVPSLLTVQSPKLINVSKLYTRKN